jgi:hypothetical protein
MKNEHPLGRFDQPKKTRKDVLYFVLGNAS